MALGNYTPPQRVESDKLDVRSVIGRPLLVKVIEYRPEFTSAKYPNPKPVVIVDVADLLSGNIYVGPMWGAGAVVDGLKENAGRDITLPVMPVSAKSNAGNDYVALTALEGDYLRLAEAWYEKYPEAITEARNAKLAKARPLGQLPPEPSTPAAAPVASTPAAPVTAPQPVVQQPAQPVPVASNDDQPFPTPASDNDVASALARLNAS